MHGKIRQTEMLVRMCQFAGGMANRLVKMMDYVIYGWLSTLSVVGVCSVNDPGLGQA